jgi:hypothetical protein
MLVLDCGMNLNDSLIVPSTIKNQYAIFRVEKRKCGALLSQPLHYPLLPA